MGDRERIQETLRNTCRQLEEAVASISEGGWSSGVYENGWNAKQLLCHLVGGSPVGFIISMASRESQGAPAGDVGDFDLDAFNNAEVAKRQDRSIEELMAERRSVDERDVELVQRTPEEILGRHYKAPWGAEGSVAEVIIGSLQGHTGQHLADLRTATGG